MSAKAAARDTIAAIATPPGRGGIGVVRVSGPLAESIAKRVGGRLPQPRQATRATFRDAAGRAIDDGLLLYFAAPASYTGEPVVEFHGHGGMVVLQSVLEACIGAGARPAEPGEFTRRSFLEGKIDLAQAEAVADLIDAASREAARSAMRSLAGEFSAAVSAITGELTELRALTEAMLDFPEEDVDSLHREDAASRLERIRAALRELVERSRQGALLATGIHAVLAGRPNVGKSSLLNRLSGRERAIVTSIPGTTRDALHEPIDLDGVPLVLVDTAGLRAGGDEVERLGMERTRAELGQADVILAVHDASAPPDAIEHLPSGVAIVDVYNKIDLVPGYRVPHASAIGVSAQTGEGLPALRRAILEAAGWAGAGETVFLARARHLDAMTRAAESLRVAASHLGKAWELFAEELRNAQAALTEITGEFTADDLLGVIFARFCIGK